MLLSTYDVNTKMNISNVFLFYQNTNKTNNNPCVLVSFLLASLPRIVDIDKIYFNFFDDLYRGTLVTAG